MYYRIIRLKKLVFPAACVAFILCLVAFSKTSVEAAVRGLELWLGIVFPSLFPFFVASNLLNGTNFIKAAGILLEPLMKPFFNVPGHGSFAFAMGITSGYPVGAKITAGMRQEKLLTKAEAERLLAFSNNSGPLFIVGAVSVGMFGMPKLGIFLLACHIAACITVGFLFRFYRRNADKTRASASGEKMLSRLKKEMFHKDNRISFGILFGNAVKDSVMLLLAIGGFIILFSVIISLLLETGVISGISGGLYLLLGPLGVEKGIIEAVLSGVFEITMGNNLVSKVRTAPLIARIGAASFVTGWAGLSVHAQVASIVSRTDISIKPYLAGKLLQGIIAAVYSVIGFGVLKNGIFGDLPAFARAGAGDMLNWQEYFSLACLILLALLLLTALLALIGAILKRRFLL